MCLLLSFEYRAGKKMEAQTQAHDQAATDHSDHVYVPLADSHYDELIETIEECVEVPGAPLPRTFLELRVPEMAVAVNQLRLSDAAEVVRRLPLPAAIALCDFRDLNRRPLIFEHLAPGLAVAILEELSSDERTFILSGMSAHERHRLLPILSTEVSKEVNQLLRYEDDTAAVS
jgi:Mg/Co/Ni transporter MgtE